MSAHTTPLRRLALASLSLFMLAQGALAPAQAQTPQSTSITLPDGVVCQPVAGPSSIAAFQGLQVTYTCSDNGVLLGNPTQADANLTVTRGTVQNGAITAANTLTVQITRVDLVDGSICQFAGGSTAPVVNGQRLNYTCGNPQTGLLGNFNLAQPLWTANKVTLQGNPPTIQSQATIGIRVLTTSGATPTPGVTPTPLPVAATSITLPDGTACQFAGTGATAVFNGQRVNYTCGTRSDGGTTVILGTPTVQNGVWSVNVGIVDNVNNNPSLRSSQTQTMAFTPVELVDDTDCTLQTGDTPTIEGQRLNYTCGRANEGLLGDFNTSQPLWTTVKIVFTQNGQNVTINERETLGIRSVTGSAVTAVQATGFVLPDGTQCQFAGTGATISFNGQRANYTCSNPAIVILGTPTFQNGVWTVTQGNVQVQNGTPTIVSSTNLTMDITRVALSDGSNCAFATGAPITVGGQPMNYTCGDPSTGLVGAFDTSQPLWTAQKVTVQQAGGGAFTEQSRATVGILTAFGATPGAQPGPTPTPAPAPGPVNAPPQARDNRYFVETNFRVGSDDFWNFFNARGGVETFGFPVSRMFTFLGCPVQIFQRSILQQCGTSAPVVLLNLLDPGLFPYTRVNGSVFPGPDDALKAKTPAVGSPNYDQAIIQFTQDVAPNTWNGLPVNFFETFNATGGLEIWGAPISNPAYDPSNNNFVYQRFQRGIMHFATGQGTRGILLADYFKAIILGPQQAQKYGANLPADLNEEAKSSNNYSQYCPGATLWVCRAQDLPGSDLTYAFEPN